MTHRRTGSFLSPGAGVFFTCLCLAIPVLATDYTWDGGAANVNWTNHVNWVGDSGFPNNSADKAIFEGPAPRQPTANSNVTVGTLQVNGSTNWTWSGTSTVTVDSVFHYGSTGTGSFYAALSGAGGLNVATGMLVICTSNNSFTGDTVIKGGTVFAAYSLPSGANSALGNSANPILVGDTTGYSDASLILTNSGSVVARTITVQAGNSGVITLGGGNTSGAITNSGTVNLNKDVTLTAASGGTFEYATALAGGSNITKTGAGAVRFGGAMDNTCTGTVYVNQGTLSVAKTGGAQALSGNLVVGDGTGGANADIVQLSGVGDQITNTSSVTVNSSGKLDLNSLNETVGALTVNGGNVVTGTGTFTLGGVLNIISGTITLTAAAAPPQGTLVMEGDVSASGTANITSTANDKSSYVSLGGVTRTFDVAGGGTLTVAVGGNKVYVTDGGDPSGITKIGAGTLYLAENNTYSGTTWVKEGTLQGDMDPNKKSFGNTTSAILVGDTTGSADATLYIKGGNVNFARDITVQTGSTGRATLQFEGSGSSRDVKIVTMNKSTYFKVSSSSGYHAMDGKITGPGDLIKTGPTILDITCATNDYTGKTIILEGYLQADTSITNLGAPSAGNEEIIIGDTSGSAGAGLQGGNTVITVNRNVRIRAGSSGEAAFLNGGGSGKFVVTGDITLEKDLTWRQNLNDDMITGRILTSGAGGDLIKYNAYILMYTNVNAPQHINTRINAGTIQWKYTQALAGGESLAFGTGDIYLQGGSFEFYVTDTSGSGTHGITLSNPIHATGTAGGLYGWQDNSGGLPNITFSGAIELSGVMGVGSRTAGGGGSAMHYTGNVTVNQVTGGLRAIVNAVSTAAITAQMEGNIVDGNGNIKNPLLMSASGGTVTIAGAASSYIGGTLIDWSGYSYNHNNTAMMNVTSAGKLGNGDVTVLPGGRLRLNASGNINSGASLTVQSSGVALGLISMGADALAFPTNLSTSSGILGIDTNWTGNLDMSTVGNGTMLLGSASSGTYSNTALGSGASDTYRLGGGNGTLTITYGVLTGATKNVTIGSTRIGGNGTVVLNGTNDFGGSLEITGYNIHGNDGVYYGGGSILRGVAKTTAGASPFGATTGDVTMHGSVLQLTGAAGGQTAEKHTLTFDGLARVNVDANTANATTLKFDSLSRGATYGGSILAIKGVQNSLGSNEKLLATTPPPLRNGDTMLDPWYLSGTISDSAVDFLTYTGNGFVRATATKNTLTGAVATDIVSLGSAQSIAAGTTISVWALDCNNYDVTKSGSGNDVVIQVGGGGLICNKDSNIGNGVVIDFGANEGIIFGNSWRFKGNITGSGGITVGGNTGWISLFNTARNSFTGNVTLLQGEMRARWDDATGGDSFGNTDNDLYMNGARLYREDRGDRLVAGRTITIGPLGAMFDATATIYGQVTGVGRLSVDGGTITLDNGGSTLNNYQGGTILYGGDMVVNANSSVGSGDVQIQSGRTLTLKGNANVSSSANIKVDGTMNLYSAAPVIGSIQGRGSIVLGTTGVDTTLAIGGDNSSSTFYGVIGQASGRIGSLTKSGNGTLTIKGTNTYTGTTTVSAGKLALDGSVAGNVSVSANATLTGAGIINGNLTMANGAIFSALLNATNDYTRLTVTGTVTLAANTVLSTTLGYQPSSSDTIYLMVNPSSTAVSGTFMNAAEGTRITLGTYNGKIIEGTISYLASADGTANDIALTGISEISSGTVIILQ